MRAGRANREGNPKQQLAQKRTTFHCLLWSCRITNKRFLGLFGCVPVEGRVRVEGAVVSRTDDPEEYIQDYIIQDDAGAIHYCDEQEVRLGV